MAKLIGKTNCKTDRLDKWKKNSQVRQMEKLFGQTNGKTLRLDKWKKFIGLTNDKTYM